MNYIVPPGLYAIGSPTPEDPVLVTANYKMSYDIVRKGLSGRTAWLLVLETFGINVWCAAGKGTFGTDELIRRIQLSGLSKVVSHRQLLLPILGAPGIAAHEVKKRIGFSIDYAAIKAKDLPEFLDNGMITSPSMREVTFTTYERLILIPVELVSSMKHTLIILIILGMVFGIIDGISSAILAITAYLGAEIAGLVITPLFLPWLPARSFSIKGAIIGFVWSLAFVACVSKGGLLVNIALFFCLPAVSAFYALNFTGCTTFTSRSGVKKEIRLALPIMGIAIVSGLLLLAVGRFA
jgi:acetyl-CoA decarbonylase/synthase complex subunit gamma